MNTFNREEPIVFYSVGLACEAAPHIACGIRAKPILAALESSSLVSGAWFSRSGAALAVEWARPNVAPDQQIGVIKAALGAEPVVASKIADPATVAELNRSFADRRTWYRKEEIDELSEEESWVIAGRLVQRMLAIVDLDARRQETVKRVVAHASAGALTTSEPGTLAAREKLLSDAILNAACCELEPAEVEALKQAIARGGHRPAPGEE